jgi:predicted ATP-grasp superfamily ATP-dependent carboligase
MRILVVGINIRHIAGSASRAGHEVIAVDCYCDQDLSKWARETQKLPRDGWARCLPILAKRFRPDAVVFGPGLEEATLRGVPVLNNPGEKTSQVSDKLWLSRWLEKKGFPFIRTETSPEGLSYPFLVKPRKGAGGVGCRAVASAEELGWQEGLIFQDLVRGLPASVSVIGNGREARAIAENEQLIGLDWAGANGFRYSGNITPLSSTQHDAGMIADMMDMAEKIISGLGLVGSNGVDFLLTENGPVAVEVNSRFQGSLDAVELAFGINVFDLHLRSFSGEMPKRSDRPRLTAGRVILYARHDLTVKNDLMRSWTADVPLVGSRIQADEPLLSITAQGSDRDEVMAVLRSRSAALRQDCKTK